MRFPPHKKCVIIVLVGLLAVVNTFAAPVVLPLERAAKAATRSLSAVESVTNVNDFEYFVRVQIGDQTLRLQLDTGSSDVSLTISPFAWPCQRSVCLAQLWVLGSDVDFQSHAACKSKHTLFNRESSPTWTPLGTTKVSLEYGSGALSVWPGTDTVTFGEATVTMRLGVASKETGQPWLCFDQDGILGLAYPSLALVSTTPWFFEWADATSSRRVMSFYLSPHGEDGSFISLGAVDASKGVRSWYWMPLIEYKSSGQRTHAFFAAQIYFAQRSSYLGLDSTTGARTAVPAAQYAATTTTDAPVIPGVVDTGTSLLLMPPRNFVDFEQSVLAAARAQGTPCVQSQQSSEILCPITALPALPNITLTVKVSAASSPVAPLQDIIIRPWDYTCCERPCASAGFCAVRVGGLPDTLATDEWLLGDTFQIAFATAYDMDENRIGIRAMTAGTIVDSEYTLPQEKAPLQLLWLLISGISGGIILILCTAYAWRFCNKKLTSVQQSRDGTNTINPLNNQPTMADISSAEMAPVSETTDHRHNA